MTVRRATQIICLLLFIIQTAYFFTGDSATARYATQFRANPNAPPSHLHWLGTDELGRDRFWRVLYGTQISLLLAPAAAFISVLLATVIGGVAGYGGGRWERLAMSTADLFLCMPWLFLLLAARALLPLNVSPLISATVTFLLLGLLGWASAARILCAGTRKLRNSDFVVQARASGMHGFRLVRVHVLPNVLPIIAAQFWVSVPLFIISEANLGMLGLGIAEPMPSWGSLLRELEALPNVCAEPWKLAPLLLLILVVGGFQLSLSSKEDAL